jgi:hypothetical protein
MKKNADLIAVMLVVIALAAFVAKLKGIELGYGFSNGS